MVIDTLIITVPAIIGALLARDIRRRVKTPSGDTIGAVVERTHDLSSADLALTKSVHEHITGDTPIPPPLKSDAGTP